jgi:hypothetical protein
LDWTLAIGQSTNQHRYLRDPASAVQRNIYTPLVRPLSPAGPSLSVDSSSTSLRSHLECAERNYVHRSTLHPRPPQSQRHQCCKLFHFFLCISSTSCASTAISIPCFCCATKSPVCLDSTDCARSNACGMASTSDRWRRRRGMGRRSCGQTFFCVASAAATEVYD